MITTLSILACAPATLELSDGATEPTDYELDSASAEEDCEGHWVEVERWEGEYVDDVRCLPTKPLTTISSGDVVYDQSGVLTWTVRVTAAPEALTWSGLESRLVLTDQEQTGWWRDIPWEEIAVTLPDGTVKDSSAYDVVLESEGEIVSTLLDVVRFDDAARGRIPLAELGANESVAVTVAVGLGSAIPSPRDTISFELDGLNYWSAAPDVPNVSTWSVPLIGTAYTFP